jgi:lysophospholipase L1-like esterase
VIWSASAWSAHPGRPRPTPNAIWRTIGWKATGGFRPRRGLFALLPAITICAALWAEPAARANLGTWQRTGPLELGVENPTLTTLPSGEALLTGGARAGGSSSAETHNTTTEAELYDPARGTWSATGSMAVPRVLHTATLLETGVDAGKVLVTGGENAPNESVASAELYDPATGKWSSTGSMAADRAGQTATLLSEGEVLVVGGNFGVGPAAELYDPNTGSFSPTGPMPVDPAFGTATLLPTGEVLLAGGLVPAGGGANTQTAAAELYDPTTNTWSQTGSMLTARDLQSATLLRSGEVLIAGGYNPERGTLASAELYDPATGAFSAASPMGLARWEPTATLLSAGADAGEVLVTGGSIHAVTEADLRPTAAEVYDPVLGTWAATGPIAFPRLEHKATLLSDGQVLVAGGDLGTPANSLSSAELFTPAGVSPASVGGAHSHSAVRRVVRTKRRGAHAGRRGHGAHAGRKGHGAHAKRSRDSRDGPRGRTSGKGHKRSLGHGRHGDRSLRARRRHGKARKHAKATHKKPTSKVTVASDAPQAVPGAAGPAGPPGAIGPPGFLAAKGGVLIQIGDSLTAFGFIYAENAAHSASTGDVGAISQNNWGMWASLYSGGRIRYGGAAATAGFTSAQILQATRELLATQPARAIEYATVLAGTNDIGYELPLTITQANLTAIYDLLVEHGITPVLCTVPPRNRLEGQPTEVVLRQRNATILLNQWIAHTAQVNGWPLVDLYSALVDPETDEYKPGLNSDFLHQNSVGAQVMGQALANALAGYPLPAPPLLASSQSNTAYAVGNNLFLESVGGLPEDWEAHGAKALEVAPEPEVTGNAFTITGGASEYAEAWASAPMPVQPGDVVYLAGRIESSVQTAGATIWYRLVPYPSESPNGTPAVFGLYDWDRDMIGSGKWGTFAIETTVPNLGGDHALRLQAFVKSSPGGSGPAPQLKLAQVTWLNMTQSGVLP